MEPLVHEEDQERVAGTIERAIAQRDSFEIEYRLRHKNGSLRWLAESGKPIMDESGRPLYIAREAPDMEED